MPFLSSFTGNLRPNAGIAQRIKQTFTYTYTGSDQTITIPGNATTMEMYLWGAGGTAGHYTVIGTATGSNDGGGGGSVQHLTYPVSPGQTYTIRVGQSPQFTDPGGGGVTIMTVANYPSLTNQDITPTSTQPVTPAAGFFFGGGGQAATADGAGTNGGFGGAGAGASSILLSGSYIAIAAGGGGGAGSSYAVNSSTSPGTGWGNTHGGAGGTGSGAGGAGSGNLAASPAGGNGLNGGGGGGGGGSGSSAAGGNPGAGQGGANLVPSGGTGFNGSGRTPGNTNSSYYSASSNAGSAKSVGYGGDLANTAGAAAGGGHGLVVIRV
jgi:hypothetical protein